MFLNILFKFFKFFKFLRLYVQILENFKLYFKKILEKNSNKS